MIEARHRSITLRLITDLRQSQPFPSVEQEADALMPDGLGLLLVGLVATTFLHHGSACYTCVGIRIGVMSGVVGCAVHFANETARRATR